ncbi:MAG: DUF2975 domain-containing protein [Olsenella sp.]|jgi:hypothetical protein|nr:DUF2975 domain-containing protein [Olsenella sp.]
MELRKLSVWLRAMAACAAACGIAICAVVVPQVGQAIVYDYPEFQGWYIPWLSFTWLFALPLFAALALVWKLAASLAADKPFTSSNARLLKAISRLAAGDAAFFLVGNVALWLTGMNHPGVVLLSLVVVCAGLFLALAAAALSRLVGRAAELQEQSDLTI